MICLKRFAALVFLLAAAAVFADRASDQFDFAEGLFVEKDYSSAREEYETYIKKYSDGAKLAEARFRVAECLYRAGANEQAILRYQEALKAHGDNPLAALGRYNLGRSLAALDRHAEAAKAFGEAVSTPASVIREEAMIGQGESLIKAGSKAEAAALYKTFLADFADSPQASQIAFSRAWLLLEEGDGAGAEAAARHLLKQYPDYPQQDRARLLLCDSLTAQGKFDDADAELKKLKQGAAVKEEADLRLAWNRFRAGDKAAAAEAFAAFAKTYPASQLVPTARYNAGTAYYELGRYADAIVQFDALAADHPTSSETAASAYWLALSLLENNDPARAEKGFAALRAQTIADTERAAAIRFHHARALTGLKRGDEATAAYRELLKLYPDSPYTARAQYALGTLLAETGDTDAGLKQLEAALAAAPTGAVADAARFALAEYHYRAGRQAETLKLLTTAAAAADAPDNVVYRCAWAHFDLKQYAEAVALFTRLSNKPGTFADEARYLLGRANEERSQPEPAIAAYRDLVKSAPASPFAEKAMARLVELLPPAEAAAVPADHARLFPKGELAVTIRLRAAERAFAADLLPQARELYDELVTRTLAEPEARSAWYGLGWCRLRAKDDNGAEEAFAKVGDKPADDAVVLDALMQRGEIAYRAEKFAPARDFFKAVTAGPAAPRQERAFYMAGWSARKNGDTTAAAELFMAQLKTFPKGELAPDAALRAAEGLAGSGKTKDAVAILAPSAELPDASEDARLQYIAILSEVGEWKKVIDQCDAFLAKYPDSSRRHLALFERGVACRAAGLTDQARDAFQKTIEATDTIEAAKAQFNLASMDAEAGDQAAAAKGYLRVEMLYDYPDMSPKALYHAIEAFLKSGDEGARRADLYARKLREKYAASEWTAKAAALVKSTPAKETAP